MVRLTVVRCCVVCVWWIGHGIAQTAAQKGFNVVAVESSQDAVDRGMGMIKDSLTTMASKLEKKGALEVRVHSVCVCGHQESHKSVWPHQGTAAEYVDDIYGKITPATELKQLADCDFVVEVCLGCSVLRTRLCNNATQSSVVLCIAPCRPSSRMWASRTSCTPSWAPS